MRLHKLLSLHGIPHADRVQNRLMIFHRRIHNAFGKPSFLNRLLSF